MFWPFCLKENHVVWKDFFTKRLATQERVITQTAALRHIQGINWNSCCEGLPSSLVWDKARPALLRRTRPEGSSRRRKSCLLIARPKTQNESQNHPSIMKSKLRTMFVLPALLALCALHSALSTAEAQGTAFTYQGQLQNNGSPANGNYDFEFSLYTNAAGTGTRLAARSPNRPSV